MTADGQSQTLRSTLVPPQPNDETSEAVFNNERGDISSTEAQDESPESSALAADPKDDTEEQSLLMQSSLRTLYFLRTSPKNWIKVLILSLKVPRTIFQRKLLRIKPICISSTIEKRNTSAVVEQDADPNEGILQSVTGMNESGTTSDFVPRGEEQAEEITKQLPSDEVNESQQVQIDRPRQEEGNGCSVFKGRLCDTLRSVCS